MGTWSEERVHSDIFNLYGSSCSHAPPPRSHSLSLSRRSRRRPVSRPRGSCLANATKPSDLSKHIERAWDAPVTTAAEKRPDLYLSIIGRSSKAKSGGHTTRRRWLHAPPLISRWPPAIRRGNSSSHRLSTGNKHMSTPLMRMWRNIRRQRSAWIGLPQEWIPSHAPLTAQLPDLASCQEGTNSGKQGTHRTIKG